MSAASASVARNASRMGSRNIRNFLSRRSHATDSARPNCIYESEDGARLRAVQEIFAARRLAWNSMNDESNREMHFSLDFLLEQPYI